jgi:hypothetical protein
MHGPKSWRNRLIKVSIPEGRSNNVVVEKFTVTEEECKRWFFRDCPPPGEYTRLMRDGRLWMSDTPDEMRVHSGFIYKAQGDILINGLGIGLVIANLLPKPGITSITINEISEDVIKLVAPAYLTDPRVTINHADAFLWKPENKQRFDAIWHDIWSEYHTDLLPQMSKLARRYGHWLKPGGFHGCWKKEELIWRRDQEKRRNRHYLYS